MKVSCTQIFKIRSLSNSANLNTLGAQERSDAHRPLFSTFPPKRHALKPLATRAPRVQSSLHFPSSDLRNTRNCFTDKTEEPQVAED